MARVEIQETVQDRAGNAGKDVPVTVKVRSSGALAPVYVAATGSTTLPNPILADEDGKLNGYVDEGSYTLEAPDASPIEFEAVNAAQRLTEAHSAGADFDEKFDTLDQWTVPVGAGGVSVSGGRLHVTAGQRILYVTGTSIRNCKATVGIYPVSSTGNDTRIMLRYIDVNNYLFARVSGGSGFWVAEIFKRDAGVNNKVAGTSPNIVNGGFPIWPVIRIWENQMEMEVFDRPPFLWRQSQFNGNSVLSYTLSPAELTKFSGGAVGLDLNGAVGDAWDDFIVVGERGGRTAF